MRNQKGLAPIVIVLIIALGIGGYLIYQNQAKTTVPPQQTTQPTPTTNSADETTNWKTYTSAKHQFSIKYPSTITLKEESNGDLTLSMKGPTQEDEQGFHDGIYLTISSGLKTQNQELAAVVKADIDKTVKESSPHFDPIEENQTPVEIADLKGYKYTYAQAGLHTKIFLDTFSSRYILIDDATRDPTSQGYKKTVDQILSTFKFTN